MCAFGLGTETDGSVSQARLPTWASLTYPRQVIYPADRNGVVGLKPTVGSTSSVGIIPESRNFDVVGPITKTVADAAVVASSIVGQSLEEGPGTFPAPAYGTLS